MTDTEGPPDRRRDPPGKRASDEPCGFDSRPFRSGASRWIRRPFDGVRGVTAAREPVELEATGSTPAGHPPATLAEAMMTRNVLELPTLVLNRNWQPIHVTTVVRALVMLWNETAKVVEPDEYRLYDWEEWSELEPADGRPCIRSARRRLRVPEVVCLAHYDRLPGAAVTFSRRNVAKRDHHTCQYCGAQPGWEAITDRPRRAALAGGCVELDQLRRRLQSVQRPQGRPHPGAGRHAPPAPAGPPRVEAALRGARASGSRAGPGSCRTSRPCSWPDRSHNAPASRRPGPFTGACSWESSEPPKLADRVQILAPLLPPTWPNGEAPAL